MSGRSPRLDEVRAEVVGEGCAPFSEVIATADNASLDALKPDLDDLAHAQGLRLKFDDRQAALSTWRDINLEANTALTDQFAAEDDQRQKVRERLYEGMERMQELRESGAVDAYLHPDTEALDQALEEKGLYMTEESSALGMDVINEGQRRAAERDANGPVVAGPEAPLAEATVAEMDPTDDPLGAPHGSRRTASPDEVDERDLPQR